MAAAADFRCIPLLRADRAVRLTSPFHRPQGVSANLECVKAAAAGCWRVAERETGSLLPLVVLRWRRRDGCLLQAIALAGDDDDLGVMEEAVEDCAGRRHVPEEFAQSSSGRLRPALRSFAARQNELRQPNSVLRFPVDFARENLDERWRMLAALLSPDVVTFDRTFVSPYSGTPWTLQDSNL